MGPRRRHRPCRARGGRRPRRDDGPQVFVSDEDWYATLCAIRPCLRPGGRFVLETRRSEVRDWETWDLAPFPVAMPDGQTAVVSCAVIQVALPLVTFEGSTAIDGEIMRSTSTSRFRERHELQRDLSRHGFDVVDVRDAPDRPGKERVFLARAGDDDDDRSPGPALGSSSVGLRGRRTPRLHRAIGDQPPLRCDARAMFDRTVWPGGTGQLRRADGCPPWPGAAGPRRRGSRAPRG